MAKRDFQEHICRPFCSFFRAGEKEELACRGALVVERLVVGGMIDPAVLPGSEWKRSDLWQVNDPLLGKMVCGRCPFRDGECDYRAAERPADAEPCGGYILLRVLRKTGAVSADALREACDD